jgi:hypothetical protein
VTVEDRGRGELHAALQATRLISFALALGVILFAGLAIAVCLLGADSPRPGGGADPLVMILSLAHLALLLTGLVLSPLLFRVLFSPARVARLVAEGGSAEEVVERVVRLFQGAHIVRLACLEGPALFGLVVLVLAGAGGDMGAEPLYWLNLGGPLLFLALVVATFPTTSRVNDLVQDRLRRG